MTSAHHDTPTGRLAGRTALVTGSTSGIGAAIARTLATEGAQVAVSGRDAGRGQAVIAQIEHAGGRATYVSVDLAGSYAELREFAAAAAAALGGRVDVLVNNAGIYPATLTEDLSDADLDAMLAVNVRAPHVLVAAIAPAMAARGNGVIVNIGAWAAEYGPRGVRVNTVAPGATLTPGNEAARAALDAMTATTPAGVPIAAQDIANGVLFLASDDAKMMHGSILSVDGGITSTRLG